MNEYVYYSRGVPLKDCYGDISLPREKIVRCRNCKYYEPLVYRHFSCELLTYPVTQNGFCAWSELREEGETK